MEYKMCIWPDGTYCDPDDVEWHLTFMSDDFIKVSLSEAEADEFERGGVDPQDLYNKYTTD